MSKTVGDKKRLEEIEKALDKAINVIQKSLSCNDGTVAYCSYANECNYECVNKEKLKGRLMKDETNSNKIRL